MKLQRDNKYTKKIAVGISTLLLTTSMLSGCADGIYESYIPVHTPSETEIVEVVSTPSAEEPVVIETPTPEIEAENSNSYFKRFSEEEASEAIEKMLFTDPEEVDILGFYYAANFYVDGEPKVMFGKVKNSNESNKYIFVDLFTGEELFEYLTTNEQGKASTWNGYNTPPLEFDGIHPYFKDNNIELRCVDNVMMLCNFYYECGIPIFDDEELLSYYLEILPDSLSGYDEFTTAEVAHIYLNIVPESMWVTSEDLKLAKEEPIKTLG